MCKGLKLNLSECVMADNNDILMPKLGLTMTEGVFLEWCVESGAKVTKGDVIFAVENDKSAVEIEAQHDGVMGELLAQPDDVIAVGEVVARWQSASGAEPSSVPSLPAADKAMDAEPVATSTPVSDSTLNPILMPKLGLTMTEGLLLEWCVKPGESIRQGDTIFVVENDKSAVDVEAQADGVIEEILVAPEEMAAVGAAVALWTGPAAVAAESNETEAAIEPQNTVETAEQATPSKAQPGERIVATPYARKIAKERSVDLHAVIGSGPNGRIKACDLGVSSGKVKTRETVRSAKPGEKYIAEAMVRAKQEIPHFYLAAEAEVSTLLAWRKQHNAVHPDEKVSINDLIVAAVGKAMAMLPQYNRIWRDGHYVEFGQVDVGIAVDTPRGLYVPVSGNVDSLGIRELASQNRVLIDQARKSRLAKESTEGGAITVSNAGMHNVTWMSSIINLPQSAILGVGSIKGLFRPDENGGAKLCQEMGLVLSCDHRVLDGANGLILLNQIIELLEAPDFLS